MLDLEPGDVLALRHLIEPSRGCPAMSPARPWEPGNGGEHVELAAPAERGELLAVEGGGQRLDGVGKDLGDGEYAHRGVRALGVTRL